MKSTPNARITLLAALVLAPAAQAMLATIHDRRGEVEPVIAAQAQAIAQLESKRPKIQDHELERFENDLKELRQTLAQYEAKRK